METTHKTIVISLQRRWRSRVARCVSVSHWEYFDCFWVSSSREHESGGVKKLTCPGGLFIYISTHVRLLSHIIYQTEKVEWTKMLRRGKEQVNRNGPAMQTYKSFFDDDCAVKWLFHFLCLSENEILLPIVMWKGSSNYLYGRRELQYWVAIVHHSAFVR